MDSMDPLDTAALGAIRAALGLLLPPGVGASAGSVRADYPRPLPWKCLGQPP